MGLEAGYLEIEPDELADFLLKETGQFAGGVTNPQTLLEYLKLKPLVVDLEAMIPQAKNRPRGALCFEDRIVAVHHGMYLPRTRFTVLHEVAHYVLPHHQNNLYICGEADLSPRTRSELERQASEFAADLLFQQDRFTLASNSMPISASSVKQLGDQYQASYEATARRMVEKSFRTCMLVVFEQELDPGILDPTKTPTWRVRYSAASPAFSTQYFSSIQGTAPEDVVRPLMAPGRDIADSITRELSINGPQGQHFRIRAEFFYNTFNVFSLLTPVS